MYKQLEEEIHEEEIHENESSSLLDGLLKHKEVQESKPHSDKAPASLIAFITGFDEDGYAIVEFSLGEQEYMVSAESIVELKIELIGRQCLVSFMDNDIESPVITGIVQSPLSLEDLDKPTVIRSDNGIILKCGSSRIELTEDGTINIQGMHINSQAYGPHRIKGGSVKIN